MSGFLAICGLSTRQSGLRNFLTIAVYSAASFLLLLTKRSPRERRHSAARSTTNGAFDARLRISFALRSWNQPSAPVRQARDQRVVVQVSQYQSADDDLPVERSFARRYGLPSGDEGSQIDVSMHGVSRGWHCVDDRNMRHLAIGVSSALQGHGDVCTPRQHDFDPFSFCSSFSRRSARRGQLLVQAVAGTRIVAP